MAASRLGNYVEVDDRIIAFHVKYPEGSLQATYDVRDLPILKKDGDGKEVLQVVPHIIVKAYAYRDREDPTPGVGLASEPVPGFTQFTKGSELMNAETSAWGRALVALGFLSKGDKIASANEVRNRTVEEPPKGERSDEADPRRLTSEETTRLSATLAKLAPTLDAVLVRLGSYGKEKLEELTPAEAVDIYKHFSGEES